MRQLLFLSIFIFSFCTSLNAQKLVESNYVTKDFKIVAKDSAYYYYEAFDHDSIRLKVRVYTLDSQIVEQKYIHKVSGVEFGNKVLFYPNGRRMAQGVVDQGNQTGIWTYWYKNAQPWKRLNYSEQQETEKYLVVDYWDTLGIQKVKEGFGEFSDFDFEDCKCELGRGKVKDGKKDSIWTANLKTGNLYFQESYELGVFIGGTCFDKEGVSYKYSKLNEGAEFMGGIQNMYRFISSTVRYPEAAERSNAEGMVYVEFTIKEDGLITEISINRGVINQALNEEAVRVVRSFPKWKPAKFRGQPVSSKAIVPIKFELR